MNKTHLDEIGKRNEVEEVQKLELEQLKDEARMLRERSMNITKESKKKKTAIKEIEKQINNKDTIINDLRVTNGIMWKENSDLKIAIDNKAEQIKRLEGNIGEDKNYEIDVIVDTSRVNMNKDSNETKCNACNTSFVTSKQLDKHIEEKHNQKDCNFCEKTFPNKNQLKKHMDRCVEYGNTTANCNKCQKTVTRFGLKNHIERCHGKQDNFSCPKCGQKGSSINKIKKHMEEEHSDRVEKNMFSCPKCGQKGSSINEMKKHMDEEHSDRVEKSREVCPHWRRGNCFRGDHCSKSHVGYQQEVTGTPSTTSWMPACRNSEKCVWMAKGICQFFHKGIGVQKTAKGGGQSEHNSNQTSTTKLCRYNEKCFKKSTCSFKHTLNEVFSSQRGQLRQPGRSQNSRRFNQ